MMTIGVGESYIADQIAPVEDEMQNSGISLAYLPSPGVVKLRLSSYDQTNGAEKIHFFNEKIQNILGDVLYSAEEKSIYQFVHELLIVKNNTLSIVESCTGESYKVILQIFLDAVNTSEVEWFHMTLDGKLSCSESMLNF